MKNISNYYVPIEDSDLLNILPEGVKILYSTLCYSTKGYMDKKEWNSHILITDLGIAYAEPNDNDSMDLKSSTWREIHDYKFANFKKKKIYFNGISFTVIRDDRYESEAEFKKRSKVFGLFCKSFYDQNAPPVVGRDYRICPVCKTNVLLSQNFCPKCGKKI